MIGIFGSFINYINTEAGLVTLKVIIGLYVLLPLLFLAASRLRVFRDSGFLAFVVSLAFSLIFILVAPNEGFRVVLTFFGMWGAIILFILVLLVPFWVVRLVFGGRLGPRARRIFVLGFFLVTIGIFLYEWSKTRTSISIPIHSSMISLMVNNPVYTVIIGILFIVGLYWVFFRD